MRDCYKSVIVDSEGKKWTFSNVEQVKDLRARIVKDMDNSVDAILSEGEGIELLRKIKFEQSGYDILLQLPRLECN